MPGQKFWNDSGAVSLSLQQFISLSMVGSVDSSSRKRPREDYEQPNASELNYEDFSDAGDDLTLDLTQEQAEASEQNGRENGGEVNGNSTTRSSSPSDDCIDPETLAFFTEAGVSEEMLASLGIDLDEIKAQQERLRQAQADREYAMRVQEQLDLEARLERENRMHNAAAQVNSTSTYNETGGGTSAAAGAVPTPAVQVNPPSNAPRAPPPIAPRPPPTTASISAQTQQQQIPLPPSTSAIPGFVPLNVAPNPSVYLPAAHMFPINRPQIAQNTGQSISQILATMQISNQMQHVNKRFKPDVAGSSSFASNFTSASSSAATSSSNGVHRQSKSGGPIEIRDDDDVIDLTDDAAAAAAANDLRIIESVNLLDDRCPQASSSSSHVPYESDYDEELAELDDPENFLHSAFGDKLGSVMESIHQQQIAQSARFFPPHFRPYNRGHIDYSSFVKPLSAAETERELRALLENAVDDEAPPAESRAGTPEGLRVNLLEHQKIGLQWMIKSETSNNKGGILSDDMGLGKVNNVALIYV